MVTVSASPMTLDEEYLARFPGSRRLYEEAVTLFPSGVTHDNRYFVPFPLYVTHAKGSRKYDVDGNELVDYWVGHGSLLLGHGREEVVAAVTEQLQKGTHFGACHELELQWAKLVRDLVPCAEEVKFTSSGTEATLVAFRLARAYTGRKKILKFTGHFHGWHDYATLGVTPPFDAPTSLGIPAEIAETMVVVPANDDEAVRRALEAGDVAAVILEPSGGFHGVLPVKPGFHQELRELTRATETLLIFDEVITGFRWAPGGAQEYYGVTPDLSTHAKVLAGGLPGGAVVGRADAMNILAFPQDPQRRRFGRIAHPGTFNANPVSAASGVAALSLIKTGEPTRRASELAAKLREGMSDVLERLGVRGVVYGDASVFWVIFGPNTPSDEEIDRGLWQLDPAQLQRGIGDLGSLFRRGMLLGGVDVISNTGMLSAAHDEDDLDRTVQAFDSTLKRLADEGHL
jgi:glutamate-1-semialdehyde 2,1-aminomutase